MIWPSALFVYVVPFVWGGTDEVLPLEIISVAKLYHQPGGRIDLPLSATDANNAPGLKMLAECPLKLKGEALFGVRTARKVNNPLDISPIAALILTGGEQMHIATTKEKQVPYAKRPSDERLKHSKPKVATTETAAAAPVGSFDPEPGCSKDHLSTSQDEGITSKSSESAGKGSSSKKERRRIVATALKGDFIFLPKELMQHRQGALKEEKEKTMSTVHSNVQQELGKLSEFDVKGLLAAKKKLLAIMKKSSASLDNQETLKAALADQALADKCHALADKYQGQMALAPDGGRQGQLSREGGTKLESLWDVLRLQGEILSATRWQSDVQAGLIPLKQKYPWFAKRMMVPYFLHPTVKALDDVNAWRKGKKVTQFGVLEVHGNTPQQCTLTCIDTAVNVGHCTELTTARGGASGDAIRVSGFLDFGEYRGWRGLKKVMTTARREPMIKLTKKATAAAPENTFLRLNVNSSCSIIAKEGVIVVTFGGVVTSEYRSNSISAPTAIIFQQWRGQLKGDPSFCKHVRASSKGVVSLLPLLPAEQGEGGGGTE